MDFPIRVYHAKDTDCTGAGICGDLFPISCEFEEIGNGLSQITLTHPVDSIGKYKALRIDNIISVFVPAAVVNQYYEIDQVLSWERRQQYFRIESVEINSNNTVTAKAKHIFYDLSYHVFKTSFPPESGATAAEMINFLNSDSYYIGGNNPFRFYTDIEGTFYPENFIDKDIASIILDPESGICNVANGYLIRDNRKAYILESAGYDRGITIEYGKNLKYVSMTTDFSNVCTRIRPIGTAKNGDPLYLSGNEGCVDSTHINDYSFQRVVTLTVSDAVVSDDMSVDKARQLMREEAEKQFDSGADLPDISLRVEYSKLSDDPKYAQYKELEKVFLYDVIRVIYPALGIDQKLTVTRIIYDVVRGVLVSIELGKLQDLAPSIAGWQISGGISSTKIVTKGTKSEFDIAKYCQSGSITSRWYDSGDTTVNVAFPKAFTKNPSVCATIENVGNTSEYSLTVSSISHNGFKLHVYNSSEMSQEFKVNWIAVTTD